VTGPSSRRAFGRLEAARLTAGFIRDAIRATTVEPWWCWVLAVGAITSAAVNIWRALITLRIEIVP